MKFVIAFAPLFSKPVFNRVKVLVTGAILSPASRTVTNALRVMGLSQEKHFQNYHRVLNRAEWSCLKGSKILLNLLIKAFGTGGEIVIGFDDTVERRRGKQIKAKGIYRDAVRSSKSFFVKTSGLRWLSFMLLTEVPFASKVWALPFLTVLCPSERYDKERGIRHRKLTDRARQAILLIKRWLPEFNVVFVGDSSYAALDLLNAVREKVTVVSKLRLDAALYRKARARRKGQLGRGRKKGKRLASLQAVIAHPKTRWKRMKIKHWYGEKNREIEIASGKCVWYHVGKQAVPMRWVIIRDPSEKFETQALLCTLVDAAPKKIVEWFIKRWQVEVTFEETRRHLGIETNRQWSDKAIGRTTPGLYGMFSVITMVAQELSKGGKLKIRSAVWYKKELATFSDAIGCVRQYLWEKRSFQTSPNEVEMIKIPRPYLECLTDTLCFVT
ncbi:MAG: transposase [Acidobacteriota bacterium]|nr:transposase [Acidobacteriota bacterium]